MTVNPFKQFRVAPTPDEKKAAAWQKATATTDPNVRIDCDGRYIRWDEYGKLTKYGWQIDHIIPEASGGTDDLWNLRARHWLGNTTAGGYLGAARK